jgi:hypothetical protein
LSTPRAAGLLDTPDLLSREVFGDRLVTLPPGFFVPVVPPGLAAFPTDSNHRLGRYFERVVEEGIRALGPVRFHAGVVVREERVTLGELDFVFQLPGEDFARHWEISCKYYLEIAGRFMGLMTRDRLDLKIPKLMEQQLRLPERPAARALLDRFGYPPQLISQAWVKGILFYNGPAQVPREVSPGHWRGRWSVGIPSEHAQARWVNLLPKTRWLVPYRAPLSAPTLASSDVLLDPYAMLARVEPEGGEWVERERICIVPPDWAERAAERA